MGIHFVDDRMWVTDIGGAFTMRHRELPDGFVVEIAVDD
jgi:hypothetical protein